MKQLHSAILVSLLALACNMEGGTKTIHRDTGTLPMGDASTSPDGDAATVPDLPGPDTQINVLIPEVPPGCPPEAGNEKGVGKPCTRTGTECTGGLQCSCKDWFGYTLPSSVPCFCTNPSYGSTCSSCGNNASCCTFSIPISTTTFTVSGCFPSVCLADNKCPVIQL